MWVDQAADRRAISLVFMLFSPVVVGGVRSLPLVAWGVKLGFLISLVPNFFAAYSDSYRIEPNGSRDFGCEFDQNLYARTTLLPLR